MADVAPDAGQKVVGSLSVQPHEPAGAASAASVELELMDTPTAAGATSVGASSPVSTPVKQITGRGRRQTRVEIFTATLEERGVQKKSPSTLARVASEVDMAAPVRRLRAQATLLATIKEGLYKKHRGGFDHQAYVLDPNGELRRMWDITMIVLLSYIAVFAPFQMAFLQHWSVRDLTPWWPIFVVDRVVDTYFLFDIFLNFRTAQLDEEEKLIFEARQVAHDYLTGWFVLDFTSTIPWDLLELVRSAGSKPSSLVRIPKMLRLLRLAKLLKVLRAGRVFKRWEQRLIMTVKYGIIRLVKFVFVIAMAVHWMGCGYYFVHSVNEDSVQETWIDGCGLTNAEISDHYVAATYWATMTVTTIGYGDISPVTTAERVYVLTSMIVGAGLFSYVIGTICTLVTGLMVSSIEFQSRMDNLHEFMDTFHFPKAMRARANKFCFYTWDALRTSNRARKDALGMMSSAMVQDVALLMHGKVLTKIPIFRRCESRFISRIAQALTLRTYGPTEYVYVKNEPIASMYILGRGRAQKEEWTRHDMQVTAYLHAPAHFGEQFLVFSSIAFDAVQTISFCDVYVLTKVAFERVLQSYPHMSGVVRKGALKMLWQRIFHKLAQLFHEEHQQKAFKLMASLDKLDEQMGRGVGGGADGAALEERTHLLVAAEDVSVGGGGETKEAAGGAVVVSKKARRRQKLKSFLLKGHKEPEDKDTAIWNFYKSLPSGQIKQRDRGYSTSEETDQGDPSFLSLSTAEKDTQKQLNALKMQVSRLEATMKREMAAMKRDIIGQLDRIARGMQ